MPGNVLKTSAANVVGYVALDSALQSSYAQQAKGYVSNVPVIGKIVNNMDYRVSETLKSIFIWATVSWLKGYWQK
ncbi:MAG TPA: hypothetical protein VGW78_05925 [Candidatus Babeliales bacterium]|jgi:hypothetical protein|nr:hypothetical protein [Candidatus Babeliales bacterium]